MRSTLPVTPQADVFTHKGKFTAAVPSGASTGIYEAVELRDKGDRWAAAQAQSQSVEMTVCMQGFTLGAGSASRISMPSCALVFKSASRQHIT